MLINIEWIESNGIIVCFKTNISDFGNNTVICNHDNMRKKIYNKMWFAKKWLNCMYSEILCENIKILYITNH